MINEVALNNCVNNLNRMASEANLNMHISLSNISMSVFSEEVLRCVNATYTNYETGEKNESVIGCYNDLEIVPFLYGAHEILNAVLTSNKYNA